MKTTFSFLLVSSFLLTIYTVYSQIPVITRVDTIHATPGQLITVPVHVTNFSNIGVVNLHLRYSNTTLQYQGIQNINANLANFINNVNNAVGVSSGTINEVQIALFGLIGATIPGTQNIIEIKFQYLGGTSCLCFSTIPGSNEYDDCSANIVPAGFINGAVLPATIPDALATPSSQTICSGSSTNISITNPNNLSGTTFSWSATLVSGTASGWANGSGNSISQTLVNTSSLPALIRYTITPSFNGFSGTPITADATVNPLPSVSWWNAPPSQCIYYTTLTLTGGNPVGGTYTGAGVTGSNFNASAAGLGTHILTYSYSSCGILYSATNAITVSSCNAITTSIQSETVCDGSISIPVNVTNFNDVASFSLTLAYDACSLTYTTFQNANPALASGSLIVNASDGNVIAGWFSIIPATIGTGTLFNLIFQGIPGFGILNWDTQTIGACQYTDINSTVISAYYSVGLIIINPCSSIDGTITYDNTAHTKMANTTVYLRQGSTTVNQTTTDANGHFLFQNLFYGTYVLNAATSKPWGGVNAADAMMILRHFTGIVTLCGLRYAGADLNGSGTINSSDGLEDAERFVGIISSFPGGDWLFETDTVVVTGSSNYTKNFNALCRGDVNGSCTPEAKLAPAVTLENEGVISSACNADIDIPLRIKGEAEVGSISLVMDIPGGCVKVNQVTPGHEGNIVFQQNGNRLRIAWYDLHPIHFNPGEVLLTLKCSPINPASSSWNLWSIDPESEMSDGNAIPLDHACILMPKIISSSDEFYLGQNVPNPFTGNTEIAYALPEKGKVNLVISDLLGHHSMTVINSEQDAGNYRVGINSNSLAPGIYIYTLKVQGRNQEFRMALKMIIAK